MGLFRTMLDGDHEVTEISAALAFLAAEARAERKFNDSAGEVDRCKVYVEDDGEVVAFDVLVYARLHLAATDPTGKAAVVLAPVEGGPVVVYPADALHDAQGCFLALDARVAQGSILSAHLRVLQPLVKTVEPILAPTLRRLVDPLITSVRSLGQALAAHAAEPGE